MRLFILKSIKPIFLTFLFNAILASAFSQDYNQPINVQADYNKTYPSQTRRLEQIRRKLEKENEIMVRKQIEQIRYRNEVRLMNELKKKMNHLGT